MTSWFSGFGAPKSNLPPVTPLQAQRSKQIESLRNANPNVVELKRDEEYRVGFTSGSNHVTFTVYLPPEFPQTKPIITVSPPMRHGFLDENMQVVRYIPLLNFNVQTDLGKLVHTMIQDFGKTPMLVQPDTAQQRPGPAVPQYQHFVPQSSPGQAPLQQTPHPPLQPQPPLHPHLMPQHHHTPHPQPSPPHQDRPLPYATPNPIRHPTPPSNPFTSQMQAPPPSHPPTSSLPSFPGASMQASPPLSSMSPPSSSSLSSSTQVAFNGHIVEPNTPVPGMTGIQGLHDGHCYAMPPIPPSFDELLKPLSTGQLEELLEDEEKLGAVFSQVPQLSKMLTERKELYHSCEQIAKLNLSYKPEIDRLRTELQETVRLRNDLKNKLDMKCLQQQSMNDHCSLPHLLDNMRVSAADAEHQSDDMAERFLEDRLNLDEFLKQFMEQRKLLHIRRVKEEKLSQLITQSQGRY